MPDSFLNATTQLPSAESLVERILLPALQDRRMPAASRLRPTSGKADALPSGRGFRKLVLVHEGDRRQKCVVAMVIQRPRSAFGPNRKVEAQLRVFNRVAIPLDPQKAMAASGRHGASPLREGEPGVDSDYLLFPKNAFAGAGWSSRRLPPPYGQPDELHVLLETGLFKKLFEHQRQEQFLYEYCASLGLLTGQVTPRDYHAAMNLRQAHYLRTPGLTTYQIFASHVKDKAGFAKAAAKARNREELSSVMERDLSAPRGLAKEYSEKIFGILRLPGGRDAAERFSHHMALEPRRVPRPDQLARE
jgi:hypothetical protein